MSAPGDTCSGISWTYDAWGNRNAQSVTSGTCNTFSQAADGNNHLGTPYQYDAAGNMTYDGVHNYTYDAENRLTKVDSGTTASYSYDAAGNRTEKTAGGTSLEYIYDATGHVVAEDTGTSWDVGFVYDGDQVVAQYDSDTTRFMHQDHLGSVRLVTDPNGNVLDSLDFLPFGEQIAGTQPWPHKFTGYERDGETGLDNAQARYNSSSMGRFMSPDPANAGADPNNPQSWNMYSYVLNDPLSATDPTGLDPQASTNGTCTRDNQSGNYAPNWGQGWNEAQCAENGGKWAGPPVDGGDTQTNVPLACVLLTCVNGKLTTERVTVHSDGCKLTDPICLQQYQALQAAQQPSYAWNVTKAFVTNFGKNLFSPRFYKQEMDEGGCLNVFSESADKADVLGRLYPAGSPIGPDDTIKTGAAAVAMNYAASRTLTVPFRSGVVRGILEKGETGAGAFTIGYFDVQAGYGVRKEWQAAQAGTCH